MEEIGNSLIFDTLGISQLAMSTGHCKFLAGDFLIEVVEWEGLLQVVQ